MMNSTFAGKGMLRFLCMLFLLLYFLPCSYALITINSVSVTVSTCPNNGTATITASSNNPSADLYYALGPGFAQWQNNSTFSSLYPGTYSARVYDINSSDSAETTFTITGNYQLPSFYPQTYAPTCPSFSDGYIIGNADSNRGKLPFIWEMISPATGPQPGDVFNSLPADTYVLRMIDACSNIQTRVVDFTSAGTGLSIIPAGNPFFQVIGCDTTIVRMSFFLNNDKRHIPLTLSIITDTAVIIKNFIAIPLDTNTSPGSYFIMDTVPGLSYDDSVLVCLTDTCGLQLCGARRKVGAFNFSASYSQIVSNCSNLIGGIVSYNAPGTSPYSPFRLQVTDTSTNTILQDSVFQYNQPMPIKPLLPNKSYRIVVTDLCGHIFQQDVFFFQSVQTPNNSVQNLCGGCLDSMAYAVFQPTGFNLPLKLEILSGPSSASSSKPGYSFYLPITYPAIYENIVPNFGYFAIDGFPIGNYTYRLSDSCGNSITDTFSVTTVANYFSNYFYKKNCAGYYNIYASQFQCSPSYILSNITNLTTSQTVLSYFVPPFYRSLDVEPGTYKIAFLFTGYGNAHIGSLAPYNYSQCVQPDTLIITPYDDELIRAAVTIVCNGQLSLDIQADTFKGVPPFQYEIINGPQTFSLQNSGLFNLPVMGTYLARVIDSCGNSSTAQVTIDTAIVDSIFTIGGTCPGTNIKLHSIASPYFTYVWQKPNGSIFIGDTLAVSAFAPSDTGLYLIKKLIYINGCYDTAYSNYHLQFTPPYLRSINTCSAGSIQVGNDTYPGPGTYIDTLTDVWGCDSILITQITLFPQPIVTINQSAAYICYGEYVTLAANGGASYQWNTGADTATINVNPSVTNTYTVTATNTYGCTATASATVTVNPPLPFITANTTAACVLGGTYICTHITYTSYLWSNGSADSCITVNTAGTWNVTVTDHNGCTAQSNYLSLAADTISTVVLTTNAAQICANETATICAPAGFTNYIWNNGNSGNCITTSSAGSYFVTVTTAHGCTAASSPLYINVLPPPPVPVTVNGDTLTTHNGVAYQWYLNNNPINGAGSATYISQQPGTYTVAITDTNGCVTFSNGIVITALAEQQADELHIYPNPATEELFIENGQKLSEIKILNILAQPLISKKITGAALISIDISQLPTGSYLLMLKTAEGAIYKQFLKQ